MRDRRFVVVAVQAALALAAVLLLEIGVDEGLPLILPIVGVGFVLHHLLPLQARQPFFLALSWLALGVVAGTGWAVGIIAAGLLLVGICHLPLPLAARAALLVSAAAGLAWLRTGGESSGDLPLAVSLLASMFMFRLIVYLYDIRHEREPATLWARLSYFFLLPNVCFLIFPIVDYGAFRRCYYDSDAVEIYSRGVRRIVRGVSHLVLYRFVYHHLAPAPGEVVDLLSLVQMLVTSYAQLLRISGSFHLIVGILGLFGYNLPRPNFLYFLASSFTDYWRRANIYWKDFMVKIFLYPSFMRLRRMGVVQPLFVATIFVFFSTWLLHAWQWFWLLGSFRLVVNDVLFWAIFGAAVAINSVLENRKTAARAPRATGPSVREGLRRSSRVLLMYTATCLLWSFWNSPSVGAWLHLMAAAKEGGIEQIVVIVFGAALGIGIGTFVVCRRQLRPSRAMPLSISSGGTWLATTAAAGFVVLGSTQLVGTPLAIESPILASVASADLNDADLDRIELGYYRRIRDAPRLSSRSLPFARQRPAPQQRFYTRVKSEIGKEMIPGLEIALQGEPFFSNRWGMRDRDYSKHKPEGAYRVAIIGPSDAMGWGVANDEIFENRLEIRLNRHHAGGAFERYEMLNFSMSGLEPLEQLAVLRDKVIDFDPDTVFFVLHPQDRRRVWRTPGEWSERGVALPARLRAFLGLEEGGDVENRLQELRQTGPHLLEFVLGELESISRQHDILPVVLMLPEPVSTLRKPHIGWLKELSTRAGLAVIDTTSVIEEMGRARFFVDRTDHHPSVEAHQQISDRIYESMLEQDSVLGAGLSD